jgi:hypothetical protein
MKKIGVVASLIIFASIFLVGAIAFAGKPVSNIPVTTYLSDFNAAGVQYYVFSDGGGAYQDGVAGVGSYLNANGYNHITWGDWRLDLFNSTSRQVAVTLSTANAVQPGDPGYTVSANPPYWGTKWWSMHMENKCTEDALDMLTMRPGDKFTCNTLFRFPSTTKSFYSLHMGTYDSFNPEPETQRVQVSCNSSASDGHCNDWFIDPIPVVNSDGSTSPGQTRARLNYGGAAPFTNEGDFYLTFHIHVTRP